MLVIVGGAIALAAVISIVVSTRSPDDPQSSLAQTQPVTVNGAPLPAVPDRGTDPAIGQRAPVVEGQTFDGAPIRIGAPGRPAVIVFLAHWCPHCRKEVPVIVDWLNAGAKPTGVDFVAVSSGTSRDRPNYPPSAWLAREEWPLRTLADDAQGRAAQAFGLAAYPYFVALDAEGVVVTRASGELSEQQLSTLFAAAQT